MNCNICYAEYLMQSPRIRDPQVENHCSRRIILLHELILPLRLINLSLMKIELFCRKSFILQVMVKEGKKKYVAIELLSF